MARKRKRVLSTDSESDMDYIDYVAALEKTDQNQQKQSFLLSHVRKQDSFASSSTVGFPLAGRVKTCSRLSKSLPKVELKLG